MKKSKILFVTILLIIVLSTSIFLCACNKDDDNDGTTLDDYRDADWIKIYTCRSILKNPTYSAIINSVEVIDTLCDEDTSPIFEKDKYESNKDIIEKLQEYDEEFFKNKSLVIFFGGQSGGSYYVKSFDIKDASLNITLAHEVQAGAVYPTVVYSCVYLLEFPKEQLKDVTKIKLNEIFVVKK